MEQQSKGLDRDPNRSSERLPLPKVELVMLLNLRLLSDRMKHRYDQYAVKNMIKEKKESGC